MRLLGSRFEAALLPLLVSMATLGSSACGLVTVTGGTGAVGGGGSGGGSGGSGGLVGVGGAGAAGGSPTIVDKIDLVLAIDNSRSMADKQHVLELAVPDLVQRLVNPPCRDAKGGSVPVPADFGPLDACPVGSAREYNPVVDMHIGIVTSSLGGHGSDACLTVGSGKESNDDKGHLVSRKDASSGGQVETYQGLQFLAWDPAQKLAPPGEADIAVDSAKDGNATSLVTSLHDLVVGVGEIGCGYESQLEGLYRFLVDPAPYESITLDDSGFIVLKGLDQVLLDQRKRFLRPDSALVVVMLTDENDCSIRESGQFYFAAQLAKGNGQPFHLPAPRQICATSPGDVCCYSCAQSSPKDDKGKPICPTDPSCVTPDDKLQYLDELGDNVNLRCVEQKRRFGIDFLYPIDRYVQGLTAPMVADHDGQVVPNPIFSDLDPSDSNSLVRTPDLVLFTGIVGVPWQDIARLNGNGVPDLSAGLDASGKAVGGFKSPEEMTALISGQGIDTWDLILGDLQGFGKPGDPLMEESIEARSGKNPLTGVALAGPDQPLANPVNGNERSIPSRSDLQYACIFPLVKVGEDGTVSPDGRDCADLGAYASCDCDDQQSDNPLCQPSPATGQSTLQVRAKAYPGRRQLALLKGLGPQGLVASVCPAQLTSPAAGDFGYRPAVASLVERLKVHFK